MCIFTRVPPVSLESKQYPASARCVRQRTERDARYSKVWFNTPSDLRSALCSAEAHSFTPPMVMPEIIKRDIQA